MATKKTQAERTLPLNQILAGDCIEVMNSLPAGSVHEVLFEDAANYAFAMTAAPEGADSVDHV